MHNDPTEKMTNLVNRFHKRGHRFQIIVLVIGLCTITSVWLISRHIPYAELAGYPGVLLLSFMGSVSMVIPVPGLLSLCGFSLTLNPLLLGVLAGIGETIGEISGYTIGYGGSSLIQKRGFYPALKKLMGKHGTTVLFFLSIVPNPIFDVVGITAGGVKFPFKKFLATLWVGKTLKGIIIGYTCYYGINSLPWIQ